MSASRQVCEADMDPEEYAALWVERARGLVQQLNEEKQKNLRLVIALVRGASGEIRIDPADLFFRDHELIQWTDNNTQEIVFKTRRIL